MADHKYKGWTIKRVGIRCNEYNEATWLLVPPQDFPIKFECDLMIRLGGLKKAKQDIMHFNKLVTEVAHFYKWVMNVA